ncbi:unnamed protein product [Closterium sp. Naga37s-1]|nr:unnamed protein product [Closterium sp. Naga37s-1]
MRWGSGYWRRDGRRRRVPRGRLEELGGGETCIGDEAVSQMRISGMTRREPDGLLENGAYHGTDNNEYGDGQGIRFFCIYFPSDPPLPTAPSLSLPLPPAFPPPLALFPVRSSCPFPFPLPLAPHLVPFLCPSTPLFPRLFTLALPLLSFAPPLYPSPLPLPFALSLCPFPLLLPFAPPTPPLPPVPPTCPFSFPRPPVSPLPTPCPFPLHLSFAHLPFPRLPAPRHAPLPPDPSPCPSLAAYPDPSPLPRPPAPQPAPLPAAPFPPEYPGVLPLNPLSALRASPLQVGFLSSTYGTVQLLTRPFFVSRSWSSHPFTHDGITKHNTNAVKSCVTDHTTPTNTTKEVSGDMQVTSDPAMAAVRALVLACVLLLVSTSALAQRGPPGGGPPGGQRGGPGAGSGGPGGRDGPGGPGGPGGPHGPPLNLTAVGNLTADIGAQLANCAVDQKTLNGSFHLAVFKNSTGNYNLLVEAMLVDAAGGPPDSLAIVKGAVCDAAATDVLALPLAAADWQQRAGWWLLHAEARLDAFLENADAATLDALLAVLPTASPPPTSGGGGSTGGARKGQGGRRMGRELLMRAFGLAATQGGQKQGGQKQGGQKQGGQQQGGAQQAPAVSGYAVLAGSSAAGVTWGGQLMGAKMPATAV